MLRAAILALPLLLSAALPARAAECGTPATQGHTDAAAHAAVFEAVLADAEGRPQRAWRYVAPRGVRSMEAALGRLPRGWLAGPEPVVAADIGVWSLNRSGIGHNVMLVLIGEPERRASSRIHLRCRGGLWAITAIVWNGDDGRWDAMLRAQD